ncbi:23S rRNA (guanosine(2251)-2'-O)-methyltransferase RlmB [Thermomonospora cellulosilytica]|uniref:23S rRNA (Guanosine2251-2'-O)-methyltransferase n=1 Tax=Thermomonospora cellulosilytica TaxID=1411118 RepID=A0A7W3R832_9ACTN|nr:23S rRNA (guanosine(2251)-2'-O)-methyltransferase RlmB [Thermomonospora cellulosilytica]MBA9003271.1 23S rRNA (guanosine2251-2'-O)-methyltransferase [Thermomonospora cellulosilytica]
MAKRRKKGPSYTPKAEDRHWHGKRQAARAAKNAARTGTRTIGPRSARPAEPAGTGRPAGARRAGGAEAPELVIGRNPVVEALRAGVPGTALYVMSDTDERIREAVTLAGDRNIPLLQAGKGELDRMTDGAVHQGIALQVRPYRYAHPDDLLERGTPPLIVACDGITDPRNLGAVVRSAAAFGAHGVVVPERRAAGVTAGTWKASAGTLATVPVAQTTNLARQLKAYQQAGCFVAGLDARGDVTVADLELATGPFVLVVGSEGKGLGRLVAETCDLLAGIPMPGHAESLNAGVATGIALYEIARRRMG